MELDETLIELLISCPKRINDPPRKNMLLKNRHFRNDFTAVSEDKEHLFRIFLRQNEFLPEDFSVGLVFRPPEEGEIHLLRMNGAHGEFTKNHLEGNLHFGYHIHRWKAGRHSLVPEPTDLYGTFQDALGYFLRVCGFRDAETHFRFSSTEKQKEFDFR